MEKFKNLKVITFLFLISLLLVDFFIVGRIDPICRSGQGYGFAYPISQPIEKINQMRFSFSRIGYNFSHFFLFWTKTPYAKSYHNLIDFLKLDGNPIIFNIGHFIGFFLFALVLIYFFRLNLIKVILISLFFNIFHEYISEGICVDPSFNDLWVDMIGALIGVLFAIVIEIFQSFRRRKFL